ncbi:hypothetical protein CR513_54967, partial [Mucuna pruriens]
MCFFNGIINEKVFVTQPPSFKSESTSVKWFQRRKKEFEMSLMGEFKFFLKLQIKQAEDGIYIHQTKLQEYVNSHTPTSILSLDETNKKVDQTSYKGTLGSLLYLIASIHDIMFSVCLCAQFQVDPRESHLTAIKHIFRSLKGTTNPSLWYNFAGDRIEKKSTSTIALSTVEAKYISATQCCSQLLWVKQQLEDYNIFKSNIPLFCDNIVAINLSKNCILHSRAKHTEIKHHFIRGYVQKGTLDLKFISTDKQLADIFTKPLPKYKHVHIKNLLEDALLRPNAERPCALKKMQDKARNFQQIFNKESFTRLTPSITS